MKKILALSTISLFVYASQTDVDLLFSTLNFNYKEYKNSQVLDSESSKFTDLPGVDAKLTHSFNKYKISLNIEYNKGSTTYKGATWGGTPLRNREKNVYLINSKMMFSYFIGEDVTNWGKGDVYVSGGIGYRFWNRGKSNYQGDYDEKYKWPYYAIGLNLNDSFNNFEIGMNAFYHQAISPKMKAYLGSGATFDLGNTDGYRVEIPMKIHLDDNYGIIFKYIYDYWHIRKSDSKKVILNDGSSVLAYEPESRTRNSYLNLGFYFNF